MTIGDGRPLTEVAPHEVPPLPLVTAARARRATSTIFLVCGTATSTWAPMVPFAKTRLAVDDGTLGLILLALGGGSMAAMPVAGAAIHYWGSRPVIVVSAVTACAVLPLLAIAGTPLLLASFLFLFGAALGALDVSMNAQAIAVQDALRRPIMSGFHALFSVGGLVGAAGVSLLLRSGLTLRDTVVVMSVVLAAIALVCRARLFADGSAAADTTLKVVARPRVLLLGALCFICFLAEGVVLDWSAVFLRDVRRVEASLAGMGYAAFSVAMVAGRLTGDWITHRLGAKRVLAFGASVAAAGFLLAATSPGVAGAIAGFILIGVGAANIVPVLFSASGRVPGVPPSLGLATVTTIGYAGLLLGPGLVGFVSDRTSLPFAFVVVAGMLGLIVVNVRRVS
jgi:predicted MFS family arabinose efflux permease